MFGGGYTTQEAKAGVLQVQGQSGERVGNIFSKINSDPASETKLPVLLRNQRKENKCKTLRERFSQEAGTQATEGTGKSTRR